MNIDKKKILYIGMAVVLLLLTVLIVILIAHANHAGPQPENTAQPTASMPPETASPAVPSAAPEITPTPEPSEPVPAITPPAATTSSGSDIVLTTAPPSTDTDLAPDEMQPDTAEPGTP